MDVDGSRFCEALPHILSAICNAEFVAIDVEMTGISIPGYRQRFSTEEDYTRARKAAEAYQIVQVGVTCGHHIQGTSSYATETFTFSVSPFFPKSHLSDLLTRLLDRRFSVAATTYSFLRDNQLPIFQPLRFGIPYLRKDEETRAKHLFSEISKNSPNHINIQQLDNPLRAFYDCCVSTLAGMTQNQTLEPAVIAYVDGKKNDFQLRLISQLIGEDFPWFIAENFTRDTSDCILVRRITASDHAKGGLVAQQRIDPEEVDRLVGLRVIFEALTGGSFARLATSLNRGGGHATQPGTSHSNSFDFNECEASLKEKRPILVGHNMFYDLVFIYHTFFGALPDTIDNFLLRIHELFPRIVDTKYMYTEGNHRKTNLYMSLEELEKFYAMVPLPCVLQPAAFQGMAHHAGYDSALTMNLFLKQAYDLHRQQQHLEPVHKPIYRPKSNPDTRQNEDPKPKPEQRDPTPPGPSILDQDNHAEHLAITWNPMVPTPLNPIPPVRGDNIHGSFYPPWDSPFWRFYGNKTLSSGTRPVSFV
ncbi:ribonuclease H-like domain-containing protein [Camillea tinctor]|nr:ribonuclease H-like domain-containing protein [Camillea tinctor]